MERTYEVTWDGTRVGEVSLRKLGLYYEVSCTCQVEHQGIFRLILNHGDDRQNLGVMQPRGNRLTLIRRVAARNLGAGELDFFLQSDRETDCFFQVCPEEGFPHLDRLEQARLGMRDGKTGVYIPQNKIEKSKK